MITIRHLLQEKGYDVWSVEPEATVLEALQLLAEKDIGALLVMEDGELKGIFSERDYARKIVLHGKASKDTKVRDIMTSEVIRLGPDQTIEACMAVMTEKRIRHLPIIEDQKVIGVVSIGDVVKSVIAEQEYLIDQLESYIQQG
jgi:CBS domain-containing protein